MTYYETLYWWSFLIIGILFIVIVAAIDEPESLILIPLAWFVLLMGGALTSTIIRDDTNYVVTATIETVPVSTTLTHFGLDVVTDENQIIRFNEYKDIQAWKDGAKLYKIYSYKKCNFGMDDSKVEVIFRKVEQ